MGVKLSDLPPAVRERALAAAGEPAERKKASRAGTGAGAPCAGSCQCGERFASATRWERHSTGLGAGHRIWSIDLG